MKLSLIFLVASLSQAQIISPIFFQSAGGRNANYTSVRSITLQASKAGSSDTSPYDVFFTTAEDTLAAAIVSTIVTTFTVTYGTQLQVGDYVGMDLNATGGATPEIMGPITSITGVGPFTVTVTSRGAKGTTAATHLSGVAVNDQFLANAAHGGVVTNANGYDILFSTDALANNLLTWSIPAYQTDRGGTFRFQVATLSHTTNLTVYVSFGNSLISTFQGSGNICTGTNLVSWWPFGTSAALSGQDLCGTNAGTIHGATFGPTLIPKASGSGGTTSADAGGGYVGGVSEYIDVGNNASLTQTTLTLEAWVLPGGTSNPLMVFSKSDGASTGYEMYVGAGTFSFQFGDGTHFALDRCTGCSVPDVWPGSYIAVTITGSTVVMYVNAVSVAFSNIGGAANGIASNALDACIGIRCSGTAFAFGNNMNEMRLSSIVQSTSYLTANLNNYGTPYTFYTIAIVR